MRKLGEQEIKSKCSRVGSKFVKITKLVRWGERGRKSSTVGSMSNRK